MFESVNGKVNEFSENIETVREILRRYHEDDQLQVTEIKCGPGSKEGDNYMSLIKRILVKIKTNNNAGERLIISLCYDCFTHMSRGVKLKLSRLKLKVKVSLARDCVGYEIAEKKVKPTVNASLWEFPLSRRVFSLRSDIDQAYKQ